MKCVFALNCEDFGAWKDADGDSYPCSSEGKAADDACEGISTEDFLEDCEFPVETDHTG